MRSPRDSPTRGLISPRLIADMTTKKWDVASGRCLTYGGREVFTVNGLSDARGIRYHPAELDDLAHVIADALNRAKANGDVVLRDRP